MTGAPVRVRGSYAAVFSAALQGVPCTVVGAAGEPYVLPVSDWSGPIGAADAAMLAECRGETLDIGCGPGRMTCALAERGHATLGIDVVPDAVQMTRRRGGIALQRNVFDVVPGEGRWRTALLADGNIGIGGDPRRLLGRVHDLLAPRGRVVADLAPPGTGVQTRRVRLQTSLMRSRPFRWSVVGVDAIGALAVGAGMRVRRLHVHGGRWFVVLEKSR